MMLPVHPHAASVLGVPITPVRSDACKEFLAGVASKAAWHELEPLVAAALLYTTPLKRGPSLSVAAVMSCALGTSCARCGQPIEGGSAYEELREGWCCAWCVERERGAERFRRRTAAWFKRGIQLGLFGATGARSRRGRRRS